MTDRFAETARATARFAGLPGYPFVVVPHPIADNAGEEIRAKAEEVVRQAVVILGSSGRPRGAS
jgi:hypothetical protein